MKRPPIRILDLAGSGAEMGHVHGQTYADEIKAYASERVGLVAAGGWTDGPISRTDVLSLAESMLEAHRLFDEELYTELVATAEGAGITPAEAVVVGGFTDFVDTVRAEVGGRHPDSVVEDDCTAVIVPDHRGLDGKGYFGQTWDMHDSATDHVLLLRVRPDHAPAALVFTTTGCLGQIGMNELGVCVGINNLVCTDGARGVAWTSVVRGMLKASTAQEALDVLLGAELAGAHNYLIFDADGVGFNVEAMPSVRETNPLTETPIVHTNHTLHANTNAVQAGKDVGLLASSASRLERGIELMAEGPIDEKRLFELTRDPEAICQVAVDPFHIESSGAAVMRPATKDFWACWGPPSHNEYVHIGFTPTTTAMTACDRPGSRSLVSNAASAVRATASELAGKSVDGESVVAIGAHSDLWFTNIVPRWAGDLEALELASYPTADPADLYDHASLHSLALDFSQGCFAGFDNANGNRLVAMGLGLRTTFDLANPQHTIEDIVPHDPSQSGHDPAGPWYYGSGISVHLDYRRRGIGRELYQLRKSVCSKLDLQGIVAGGVMPGYAKHRDEMTADEYIAGVVAGDLYDPTLTFQKDNGFEIGPALAGYITDPAVNNNAALIVWHNPEHTSTKERA